MGDGVSCVPLTLVTVATARCLGERVPLPVAVRGLRALSRLWFPEDSAAGLVTLAVLFLFFLFLPVRAAAVPWCSHPFSSL